MQWGPIATSIKKHVGEIVGVVRNDAFAIGLQGLNVKTFVPPKKENQGGVFLPTEFKANEDRTLVICPAGQVSSYRQRDKRSSSYIYRFTRKQCDGCPLVQQCMKNRRFQTMVSVAVV